MKSKSKRLISLLLLFIMSFTTIAPTVSLAADITSKVEISGVSVYVNRGGGWEDFIIDGNKVPGVENPMSGNEIKFRYTWGITRENYVGVKAGDTITFNLPSDFYDIPDVSTDAPVKNAAGEVFGTMKVLNNKIIVTINAFGASKDALTDGYVEGIGKINKDGTDEKIDVDGGINLPPIVIDPPGKPGSGNENINKQMISKNGTQLTGDKNRQLNWDSYVNYKNSGLRFKGEPYDTLNEAFFVDEFQGPQKVNPGSFSIKSIPYTATAEGKMSNADLGYFNLAANWTSPAFPFAKVNVPVNSTVDQMKTLLKNTGKPAWANTDDKVVVYFGNIPNSNILLHGDLRNNNYAGLKTKLGSMLAAGDITQAEHNKTLEHYTSGKEDQLMHFLISVGTDVDPSVTNYDFTNISQLHYQGGGNDSNEALIDFSIGGGVEGLEARSIEITKVNDSGADGTAMPNIEFKLQKLDEGTGQYVDYTPGDGGALVRKTDAEGKVSFSKLANGKYKIVEVTVLSGHGTPKFEPSEFFEIKEEDKEGIRFKVTNPELVDVPVTKSWDYGNAPAELHPKEVTLKLLQNGKETHADGKTYSQKLVDPVWTYTFKGLPKNDSTGTAYVYTVSEVSVPNYTGVINGTTIDNTYTPIEIEGTKTWDHGTNPPANQPTQVIVKLFMNGNETGLEEIAKAPDWKYKFEGIPEFDENGVKYIYTVEEEPVEGYLPSYETDSGGNLNIKNKFIEPVEVELKAEKYLEGVLSATEFNFEVKDEAQKVVATGKNDSNGLIKFPGIKLPKAGKYKFTIHEVNGANDEFIYDTKVYNAEVTVTLNATTGKLEVAGIHYTDASGNELTSVSFYNSLNTVDIEGTKTWDHGNNPSENWPKYVNISILQNGNEIHEDGKLYQYSIYEKDNWKYKFSGFPKYDSKGVAYVYTIIETSDISYASEVTGFDIRNKYVDPIEVPIEILKNLTGKDVEDKEFEFEIIGKKSGQPGGGESGRSIIIDGESVDKIISNGADGKANISLKFSKPGEYVYTIKELPGTDPNMEYDKTEYTLKVVVTVDNVNQKYNVTAYVDDVKVDIPIKLQFNNNYPTVDLKGKKVWDDANNQDGKRPTEIKINLLADGNIIDTKTVTEADGWAWDFANLPKNANGAEIVYTITEEAVTDYTTVINGNDVTNTYTPENTEVKVTKVWEDNDNQDGKRVPITVELVKDGVDTGDVVTLDENNNWTHTWTGLDKFKEAGTEIVYTVKETGVPNDYTSDVVKADNEFTFTITNTYTPENTEVKVTKVWEDNDNQDGKRAPITVELVKDGVDTGDVVTLDENNNWTHTWTGLDKFKEAGTEIVYTVKETGVPNDYTSDVVKADNEFTFTITNTYTPENTEVKVTKVWEDNDNQDGKRAPITVELVKDGVDTGDVVTLDENNNWTHTWTGLDKFKEAGTEIVYTVKETGVPNDYTSDVVKADNEFTFTITNTYTPENTEVKVTKVWEDNDNQDGKRVPITVELVKDGVDTGDVVTLDENNNWTHTWTGLDKFKEAGTEIVYTVKETGVPNDYTSDVVKADNEFTFTITNTYTPENTEVKVTKVWEDNDNQDGKRAPITVELVKDGVDTGDVVTLDENNNWTHTWTGLDKFKEAGTEIVYTVKETGVPNDYTSDVVKADNEFTFTITNTYTPENTEVKVTKVWEDNDNQDGKRAPITVELVKDGVDTGDVVTLDENNNWTHTWTGLDKFKEAGTEIVYTVKETGVPNDYTSDVVKADNEFTFTITNTYTPENTEVKVTKVWEDNDNQDGKRAPITVELVKDGVDTGDVVTLDENNNWTHTWTGLDKFKEAGTEIVYTVKETGVPNDYTSDVVKADNEFTFTITNTYTPETVDIAGTKTWDDANNQDGKRPTEININLLADGAVIDTKVVTKADGWAWVFTELPKKANGTDIEYTITEEVVDYYVTEVDGFDVTNTYIQPTEIVVEKDLQGRKLKAYEFAFAIEGSDKAQGYYDEIENDKFGKAEFSKLEFKEAGTYSYKITEINTGDRKVQYDKSVYNLTIKIDASGRTIQLTKTLDGITEVIPTSDNSIIKVDFVNKTGSAIIGGDKNKEEIAISGSITWDDDNNKNKKRPDKVKVILYADGTKVDTQDITAAENWIYSFKKLPKVNADKTTIVYTIDVEDISNYKIDKNGFDIINRYYDDNKMDKSIVEVMEPNNDKSIRNSEIEEEITEVNAPELSKPEFLLKFLVNGMFTEDEILDESSNWKYEWNNNDLDATDIEIVYINNSKELDDDQKEVVVILKENGVEVDRKIITKADGWKYIFKELKTNLEVDSIMYSIEFKEK